MVIGFFAVRSRFKDTRALVRERKDLTQPISDKDPLFVFLNDLASGFARNDTDGLRQHVIRAMAKVAAFHDHEAFELCGIESPFKPAAPKPPAAPIAKVRTFADRWPVVQEPPHASSGSRFDADQREFSALKMFGYTVGTTAGWPERERREFLSDFMEMDLPPIVLRHFGGDYGEPRSMTRILKMANVIAGNANLFSRNDAVRYAMAIQDW